MLNTKQVRKAIRNVLNITYTNTWTNGAERYKNKRELCFVVSDADAQRLDEVKTVLYAMGHKGKVHVTQTFAGIGKKYLRITRVSIV